MKEIAKVLNILVHHIHVEMFLLTKYGKDSEISKTALAFKEWQLVLEIGFPVDNFIPL